MKGAITIAIYTSYDNNTLLLVMTHRRICSSWLVINQSFHSKNRQTSARVGGAESMFTGDVSVHITSHHTHTAVINADLCLISECELSATSHPSIDSPLFRLNIFPNNPDEFNFDLRIILVVSIKNLIVNNYSHCSYIVNNNHRVIFF